jgi:hypothetical protein
MEPELAAAGGVHVLGAELLGPAVGMSWMECQGCAERASHACPKRIGAPFPVLLPLRLELCLLGRDVKLGISLDRELHTLRNPLRRLFFLHHA